MLQVVRGYATERLANRGELELLRARHAKWFLGAVRPWAIGLVSDDLWRFLDEEIDNARAVVAWALEHADLPTVATLARDLRSPWWRMTGRTWEALDWLERGAAIAKRIARGSVEEGWIALALAHLLDQAGRSEDAQGHVQSALDLFESHRVSEGIFAARLTLAVICADLGRIDDAIALARQTLDEGCQTGGDGVVEVAASILGTCYVAQGDLNAARTSHQLALQAATRMGSQLYLAMAHHQLAVVELMAGRLTECWTHLAGVAAVYSRMSHSEGISYSLEVAAGACLAEGDMEHALEAIALAEDVHGKLQLPMWPVLSPWRDRLLCEIHAATPGAQRRSRARSGTPAEVLQRISELHLTSDAVPSGPDVRTPARFTQKVDPGVTRKAVGAHMAARSTES